MTYVVYAHCDAAGSPFYIGCGSPTRPYKRAARNKRWKAIVAEHGDFTVRILSSHEDRESALRDEAYWVKFYGNRLTNGPLKHPLWFSKNEVIYFRLDPGTKIRLMQIAKRRKLTMSELVRVWVEQESAAA